MISISTGLEKSFTCGHSGPVPRNMGRGKARQKRTLEILPAAMSGLSRCQRAAPHRVTAPTSERVPPIMAGIGLAISTARLEATERFCDLPDSTVMTCAQLRGTCQWT